MTGFHQRAGVATTPFGPNVRYTIRLHVVGEDRREDGSVRGTDHDMAIRVVTPLGELRAVALAALHFSAVEPCSVFREVQITEVEQDFTGAADDHQDRESLGR